MKTILLSAFVVLLWPSITLSQEHRDEEAREAYQNAKQLFSEGKHKEAAMEFRQSCNLKPSFKIFYNIGQSEAAAKQYGAALEAFEKYLSQGGDKIQINRQKEVRDEIKRLRDLTGILEVHGQEGMVIRVDGTVRGTFPTARRVAVSAAVIHKVSGTIGNQSDEKEIQVLGGDTVKLVLEPGAKTPQYAENLEKTVAIDRSATSTTEVAPRKRPALLWAGISLASVGGAALLGGAVCGGLALNSERLLEKRCDGTVCSDAERDVEKRRDRLAVANAVLLATGGAAAAVGVSLILVSRMNKEKRKISVMPTAGGLFVQGRF